MKSPISFICRVFPVFVAVVCAITVQADETATRERRHRQHLEQRQAVFDQLTRDLEATAVWCDDHQLPDAAGTVRDLSRTLQASDSSAALPRMATPPVSTTLPLDEQQWQLQLLHHRQERAREIYSLARSALRAGLPSLAFSLVGDVLRIDPDHKYARAVLGAELFRDPLRKDDAAYAGEWVSAFEKQMRSGSKPRVLHPKFGWIPAASVARYEDGLRPWKGGWISVEKEAELRRNFDNAWEIPSEHFLIRTNVGLEAGAALSADLELFHDWLQQNLAAFFDTPAALQDRFEDATTRSSSRPPKPMVVHYYATREEYEQVVRGKVPPQIETNGLYWEPDRTSYFFAGDELVDRATHFHEATHQILDCATAEDRRKAARVRGQKLRIRNPPPWTLCEKSNAWIIEGLACYFESFEISDGQISVGRPDYERFVIARERAIGIENAFYLPSQQLFAMGRDELQQNLNIGPIYSQSAGFTHFLMHYEDGLYRDDLIALLVAIYRPAADDVLVEPSLTKIAGVSGEDFDHQYRTHMQNLADLATAAEQVAN